MSKQVINLGSAVDDFTGDYLRQGGKKINGNFTELYTELGDGSRPHAAGAWKTFVANGDVLHDVINVKIGESWHIDTSAGSVTVNLPIIGADEGRAIKLSDAFGSWLANPVIVIPDIADTINSVAGSSVFSETYQIVALMSTSPSDWKYIEGIYHNRIDTSAGSIQKIPFTIVSDSAADGNFNIGIHTEQGLNVYLNGVLLHYDALELEDGGLSEYGSSMTGPDLTPINTVPEHVQLRPNIYKAGDLVIFEIFSGAFAGVRTSYRRTSRQLVDAPTLEPDQYLYATDVTGNLFNEVPLTDLGIVDVSIIKPEAFQLFYNGVLMTQQGSAGYTPGGNNQYKLVNNGFGIFDKISFTSPSAPIFGTDVITVVYFNNVLGTLLEADDIVVLGDDEWVHQLQVSITNRMTYNVVSPINIAGEINTEVTNTSLNTTPTVVKPINISQMFDLFYPIGTVYENASNPANPGTYLGYGVWAPYSVGKVSFGYDPNQTEFSVIGSALGNKEVTITADNLPELPVTPNGTTLLMDETGDVNLAGCLPDPSVPEAPAASINSVTQNANDSGSNDPISILPPYTVSYKWVRVS